MCVCVCVCVCIYIYIFHSFFIHMLTFSDHWLGPPSVHLRGRGSDYRFYSEFPCMVFVRERSSPLQLLPLCYLETVCGSFSLRKPQAKLEIVCGSFSLGNPQVCV